MKTQETKTTIVLVVLSIILSALFVIGFCYPIQYTEIPETENNTKTISETGFYCEFVNL